MKYIYIVLVVAVISCSQRANSINGWYKSQDKNYRTVLSLEKDNTYYMKVNGRGVHASLFETYGLWKIQNDTLKLYGSWINKEDIQFDKTELNSYFLVKKNKLIELPLNQNDSERDLGKIVLRAFKW